MRPVQIIKKLKNLSIEEWVSKIYFTPEGSFAPPNIDELLLKIQLDENKKIVSYIIYEILTSNDLSAPGIVGIPKNGIELRNPDTNQPYGIYHAHLKDGYILIWYLTYTDYGLFIEFEYIKHPPSNDNYKNITNNIYNRDDGGFNMSIGRLFIDITNILNESNINSDITSTIHIDLYSEFIKKKNKL